MSKIFLEEFMSIFSGNNSSYNLRDPKTQRQYRVLKPPLSPIYKNHLKGVRQLGIIPISTDGKCFFGVIDIDSHDKGGSINVDYLESLISSKGLPLVVCKTKRGGAHCYLFCKEPIEGSLLRTALYRWVSALKLYDWLDKDQVEIFPKQDFLEKDNLGSSINIPYFKTETNDNCCVYKGSTIPFEEFLSLAESKKVSLDDLIGSQTKKKSPIFGSRIKEGELEDAPPCICKMVLNGVETGSRNFALYNFGVFAKKAWPKDGVWRDKVLDFNLQVLNPPLPHHEVRGTIGSIEKRDYKYKCKEEPCATLCNSSVCVTRKFGIDETTFDKRESFEEIKKMLTGLKRVVGDKVMWLITLTEGEKDYSFYASSEQLSYFNKLRFLIMDRTGRLFPPVDPDDWQKYLNTRLQEPSVKVEYLPDETSEYGVIKSKLLSWFDKLDFTQTGKDMQYREKLLMGRPVIGWLTKLKQRVIFFRSEDFLTYLQREHRIYSFNTGRIWSSLKADNDLNMEQLKIHIKASKKLNVWCIPIKEGNIFDFSNSDINRVV